MNVYNTENKNQEEQKLSVKNITKKYAPKMYTETYELNGFIIHMKKSKYFVLPIFLLLTPKYFYLEILLKDLSPTVSQ
jgi:hypothetical protein